MPNKRKVKTTLLSFIVSSFLVYPAFAGTVKIFISSGTGFFVSRDGYIITNRHVVNYCQRITVSGAVNATEAKLIGRDDIHDLALLKIDVGAADAAQLRLASQPVQLNERVVIVGYPGQAAQEGETVTREAAVTGVKGPQGEDKWLELDDVIEQGNSGGPLLDAAGNVVGVVTAKATIYTYRKDNPQDGTLRHSGIAISLPIVREFLDAYQVRYRETESDIDLSAHRITDAANRFTVSIRCEYPTEVR